MKTKIYLAFIVIYACTNCNSNSNDNTAQSEKTSDTFVQNSSQSTVLQINKEEFLHIKGKDIWVRDVPATGNVVMKLNEGDKCKIIEKGKITAIKGRPDYWYKIEFNQTQGWVFGSQTDIMLFQPISQAFTGNLIPCSNPLFSDLETPSSYSYSFKDDNLFQFSVAAGYVIKGIYEWKGPDLILSNMSVLLDTPDGNTVNELKGSITFTAYEKDLLVCLTEKKNNLADKTYSPGGGCFCLEK